MQMTEEEAKKEHDEIQAEIAKSKGQGEPEKKPEEDKGDEPDVTEDPEEVDPADKGEEGVEPKKPETDDSIPLPKYMQLKNDSAKEKAELETKVSDLTEALKKATTSKGMDEKINKIAETHGMPAEAVRDLAQMILDEVKPAETNKAVEAFIRKQEADEKFQAEFAQLVEDVPGATDRLDEIRAKAFEEGNLDKSLFEIYHRLDKPAGKKKTGESSRPSRVAATAGFDPKKVIEKLNSGASGALEGLTPEQQDQVFALMEKSGSRYSEGKQ